MRAPLIARVPRALLDRGRRRLDALRLAVSRADALAPMALLGIVTGVLAGLTIVAFRLLVEWGQGGVLSDGAPGDFEALPPLARFLLPATGGLALGLLFTVVARAHHRVGVLHVMERLAYHEGHLPWRNALLQLAGGAIALICGHSVGREGPSAHLGAASATLPGSAMRLPHNALRALAASGAAAGIAASFNTPLAGIAFSMEVLALEYTVAGFAPVILATIGATTIVRVVYGDAVAFDVPTVGLASLAELPFVIALGIVSALLAIAFIRLLVLVSGRTHHLAAWLRLPLAGMAVGAVGLAVPEVLGISYDTVNTAFAGQLGLALLGALLVAKLVATAVGIGLGLPGGVIGPALVMGAAAGGMVAQGMGALPLESSAPALYIAVAMGALLAAALQAPLTGLLMIVELTANPAVIFPGMLAVVAATVTMGLIGRGESIFHALMRSLGLDYRTDPVLQSLRRVGVAGVMDRSVVVLPREITPEQADDTLAREPRWILVREPEDGTAVVMPALDLARAREHETETESIDLLDLPGHRQQATEVHVQATLQEGLDALDESGAEALYVTRPVAPGLPRVYGVLTRETIETAYRR